MKTFLLIFFILFSTTQWLVAQNAVLINNYTKDIYKAANQNWAIDTDSLGNVYVANNKGLLVFDGSKWQLLQLPGKTIIRSVNVIDNKVFTGSYQEFGYWLKDKSGNYKYHSLSKLLKDYNLGNEEIWKIVEFDKKVYFQSFGAIFEYDFKKLKHINISRPIMFLLKTKKHLYVQEIGRFLYEIKDSKLKLVAGSSIFESKEVNICVPLQGDTLLFGTSDGELYTYNGKVFEPWNIQWKEKLKEAKINNAIRLKNKIIIGTILSGLYITDLNGNLVFHISTDSNLQNNTVLSLASDKNENLWVGMDKGIDFMSFSSPISIYTDKEMSNTAVYTAVMIENTLYVGTNQGIYHFELQADGKLLKKGLIYGSQGQVWFLKLINNQLYAGLNDGTYLLENNKLTKICNVTGGYTLQKFNHLNNEYLIQSTYSSLVVYQKENKQWKQTTMTGFSAPAPYLEADYGGNLWLLHSIKGVYKLQYSQDLKQIINTKLFFDSQSESDNCTHISKINNYMVFCTGDKLYTWDNLNKKIIPYDKLNSQLLGFEKSTRIIPSIKNQYWFFMKNQMALFEIEYEKPRLLYRLMTEKYGLSLVDNFENIVSLNDSLSLVCLDNGFAILNHFFFKKVQNQRSQPEIRQIISTNAEGKNLLFDAENINNMKFSNRFNNLKISFFAPKTVGMQALYQHKLEGLEDDWSDWAKATTLEYTRLPEGKYVFHVRGVDSKGMPTQITSIHFSILPPWYSSSVAWFLYVLSFTISILIVRGVLKKRWQRQKQKLIEIEQQKLMHEKELAEQQIVKLQNDNLQVEINHKNSQLATSTMAIIAKNELLSEIKTEMENFKEELGYRLPKKYYSKILHLIDQNISSENDWKSFETLFDQAHENFFKRLKTAYPDLTPGDLKLCAYLRMNLTTKEIVQLLNISIRGVEVHRYRLRKRLNLDSNQNLVEFMMNF